MTTRGVLPVIVAALGVIFFSACSTPTPIPATAAPTDTAAPPPTLSASTQTPELTPSPTPIAVNTPRPWPGPLPEGAIARLGDGWPEVVATSPDGATVAVGLSTGVEVFDTATLDILWAAPTTERVSTLAWTRDSGRLAAGLYDGRLVVWKARSGGELLDIASDNGRVVALDWTPDAALLVVSASKGISTVRDGETGAPMHELAYNERPVVPDNREPISSVNAALSPDGHLYATHYDFDGSGGPRTPGHFIVMWDVDTGGPIHVIESTSSVSTLSWSPDNKLLATGSTRTNLIELWRASDGSLARSTDAGSGTWQLFWSPDGARIAVIPSYYSGTPAIFDTATLIRQVELESPEKLRWFIDWSPDGSRISLLEDESAIVTYDTATGEVAPPASIGGRYFVRVGSQSYYNPLVKVWEAAAGAFEADLIQGTVSLYEISWLPPGAGESTSPQDYVWQAAPDQPPLAIRYSPFRGFWEGNCDDTLRLPGDDDLTDSGACPGSRAESPDGSFVAIAYNTETESWFREEKAGFIAIYDAATGARLRVLRGHASFVTQIAFSPDSKVLASGSADGTVILWDVAQ